MEKFMSQKSKNSLRESSRGSYREGGGPELGPWIQQGEGSALADLHWPLRREFSTDWA
ncbi:hypothetical protein NtRootA1_17500 [Arthrobacter sp. NtRootA1]|nr:hypothetical protein NtRootA1_17500 [Arthrobacter sp. NtRootA1]